ncbi:hypothetical protein Tco_0831586 [Tanacetum coccineum]
MQGILKKKMNLLKIALNCQYGIPILPQTHLLQNQITREEFQERKNKSSWMILQDFKGKKRKLMRKLKLPGRILNKKLRTWLLREELLNLAVLTFLVLLAQQLKLVDIHQDATDGIFTHSSYDDEGAEADFINLETIVNVSPIPTSRIKPSHPSALILGDPTSAVQTRSKVNKSSEAHAFEAMKMKLVDAMQEELLQFEIQKVWILVDLPYGKKAIGKRKEWDYDEVFAPVDSKISEKRSTMWLKLCMGYFKLLEPWSVLVLVILMEQILTGNPQQELSNLLAGDSLLGNAKKQTIVATLIHSRNLCCCCGQVLLDHNQMFGLWVNFMNTKIYIDNESTICIVKNPVYHSKTKNIAIRHHFIRDAYEKKLIQGGNMNGSSVDERAVWKSHVFTTRKSWPLFKSKKIAQVVHAWIQSKNSLVKHFEDMRLYRTFKRDMRCGSTHQETGLCHVLTTKDAYHWSGMCQGASIRNFLIFDDADGIDSLPNQAIFDAIQRMGYEGDLTDEGASSERLSVEQPSPSPAPTGEIPNESLPDSSSAQPSEVPYEQQPDPSPRPSPRPSPQPSPTPIVPDSIPEPTDQAKEIKLLNAKITKLKKQAKPVIKHHKAYLKSLSLQQRFPRKSFSKIHRMHKESVSKQGRKKAKGESSVQRNPLFDVLPEDKIDHMETEHAQSEGRTKEMVDEVKEFDEDRLSTEDEVSTVKEGVSTDFEKVSTDRPKVSTDGSKVSTDEQVEGTEEHNQGTEEIFEGSEEQREGTEEKVESTAGQIEATLLLKHDSSKAASNEKEKDVELKDVKRKLITWPTSTDQFSPVKKFKQLESDEELARKIQEDWEAEEERNKIAEEKRTK